MKGSEIFKKELGAIHDLKLRGAVATFLDECVPDYFYEVAASSTGKYHPWYSLGYGGLVRHTKAAVLIAVDLLSLEQNKYLPADNIIAALILHDTFKHGVVDTGHTEFVHPFIASGQIETFANSINLPVLHDVADLVASHMGQWNTSKYDTTVLTKPIDEAQKFVHMCDYLASRKYLTVEVE